MTTQRIRQIFIAAADFDAQCFFFETALGLALQFRDGDNWAQFSAGDISVAVAGLAEAMGAAAGTWVPVFEVDALDAALARIVEAGGAHAYVRDMGSHGPSSANVHPSGAQTLMPFIKFHASKRASAGVARVRD